MSQLPLRPNVCLFILNTDGKLFVGQRRGEPSVWQLPQGGIESTGSIEENAIREACEELGVEAQSLRVLKLLSSRHEYEWETPPAYAIGRWRGQQQSFVLLEFLGEEKDILLDRYASPEFDRYVWTEPAKLLDVVEPKRRAGYAGALGEVLELVRLGFDHHRQIKYRS